MCDYSLHGVASRPAEVGDKLISAKFRNTLTRGFSAAREPDVAVWNTAEHRRGTPAAGPVGAVVKFGACRGARAVPSLR